MASINAGSDSLFSLDDTFGVVGGDPDPTNYTGTFFTVTDGTTINPFTGVGVAGNPGDILTVTVTYNASSDADFFDTFTGAGASSTDGGFDWTITGTAADVQTILQNGVVGITVDSGGFDIGDPHSLTFTVSDGSTTSSTYTEFFQIGAPCYLAGTRIATPSGEVAVEALKIGDLVATVSGVAKPVKWIGRRQYTAAQVAANSHLRPVLIRQDALAAGMPHRDLMVSPIHAMVIDGAFISAASLVNNVSILRTDDVAPVTYVHVELEDHDVIFAEGAPAETFVNDDSRLMFDNADEYYDLYGAETVKAVAQFRLEGGYQLEAIRRRLAVRAGLVATVNAPGALLGHVERLTNGVVAGWVMDEANPATPVELELLVDGEPMARLLANSYRTDLDHAGFAGGRCAFSVEVPASVTSLSQVQMRRIGDGAELAISQEVALVD